MDYFPEHLTANSHLTLKFITMIREAQSYSIFRRLKQIFANFHRDIRVPDFIVPCLLIFSHNYIIYQWLKDFCY